MITVSKLYTEYIENPIAVTKGNPRFSWKLASDLPNLLQEAYQLTVVNEDGSVLWDSGRILSQKNMAQMKTSESLQSNHHYQIKLELWFTNGMTVTCDDFYFETGLLQIADWQAKWIEPAPLPQPAVDAIAEATAEWLALLPKIMTGDMSDFKTDEELMSQFPLSPYDPAVQFRKVFTLEQTVQQAKVFMTSHGIYELKINGKKVSHALLTPGFTTYDKRLRYQVYDIKDYLVKGDNVLVVTVADGWYKGKIALGRGREYGDVLGLLGQIQIVDELGQVVLVKTDESWTYSYNGPVRHADLFLGQKVDARLEDLAIHLPNYQADEWKLVELASYSLENLEAQLSPYVSVIREVKAEKIWLAPNGDTLVDFGQNLAGQLRVRLQNTQEGQELRFEHGETLDKEGNFYYPFTGDHRGQMDEYICAGRQEEIFQPQFTYHGFRYLRLTGNIDWKKEDFTALAISSSNVETGSFETDNLKINRLQKNIQWSQWSNNIDIPTDCPTREKAGWTGDVLVFAKTALFNQDMFAFYDDWLKSIRAEQRENGHIIHTVPQIKNYIQQSFEGSLGWADVIYDLPLTLHNVYDDSTIITENLDAMKKWFSAVKQMVAELPYGVSAADLSETDLKHQQHVINTGFHFGDWIIPSVVNEAGFTDGPMSSFLTMNVVGTCLVAAGADKLVSIAEILGDTNLAEDARQFATDVRQAFQAIFVNENGLLEQEIQGNYVLALAHQMVPEVDAVRFANRLNQLIAENDYRLDTGFMATPLLLEVLKANGYADTAWTLVLQEKCPSWLYEVNQGATSLWENWDAIRPDGQINPVSFNHYAFGCVGDFLYKEALGLKQTSPGFKEIEISPDFDAPFKQVYGHYDSPYGRISIAWEKQGNQVIVKTTLPCNTRGRLVLGSKWIELQNNLEEVHILSL